MTQLSIVALIYEENFYKDTVLCLADFLHSHQDSLGVEYFPVVRPVDTKSYTAAMNQILAYKSTSEFLWFISDIKFDSKVPLNLMRLLKENPDYAAIHPLHESDHKTHRVENFPPNTDLIEVPYVEWTAPMVRSSDFYSTCGLDADHHFWYQDLIWSREMRLRGRKLGVSSDVISHGYKRNVTYRNAVTKERYDIRTNRDVIERQLLVKKFGSNWKRKLFDCIED